MEIISKDGFRELAEQQLPTPLVTIYMPTHSSGVEVNERHDQISFKNTLQELAFKLNNMEQRADRFEGLLKPAYQLLEDESFWLSQSEGLAMFLADGFFKLFKLPETVKPELHINEAFHLTPLVRYVADSDYFYLLVFSKNASAFFKGDAHDMKQLHVAGLPQGLNDVIHFEEKSERKLFRAAGATGAKGSLHGHGSGLADDKEYIAQYVTEIDQTLHTEVLGNERAPLVLAAVEYMIGAYRRASGYGNIADKAIVGNYDHLNKSLLFEKAREIVAPYFEERSMKALENYGNQIATPLTSSMPEKVIPASFYKQIADLFVAKDAHIWGTFDEASNRLTIHNERQDGDECLVNKAIVHTVLNGGDVHVLPSDRMPKGATVAASMRY